MHSRHAYGREIRAPYARANSRSGDEKCRAMKSVINPRAKKKKKIVPVCRLSTAYEFICGSVKTAFHETLLQKSAPVSYALPHGEIPSCGGLLRLATGPCGQTPIQSALPRRDCDDISRSDLLPVTALSHVESTSARPGTCRVEACRKYKCAPGCLSSYVESTNVRLDARRVKPCRKYNLSA